MNDILTLVETEKNKVSRSLKVTSSISVILMILVFAEVLYVRTFVRSALMPEKLGSIAVNSAYEYIPELNRMLVDSTTTVAPLAADAFVDYSLEMISGIGPLTKDNTLLLVDELMAGLRAEGVPAFQKVLLDVYAGVYAERENLSDSEFVGNMINELLDIWEMKLEKELSKGTSLCMDHLDEELQALYMTPENSLSARQLAQKRTLACGQILIDRASNQ